MFGIGSTELLLILVVALVVLGPKSLAGFARSLGKLMGEFRRVSTEFQRTLNVETAQAEAREEAARKKKEQKPDAPSESPEQDIPPDSPLAREIARAHAEAEQGAEAKAQPDGVQAGKATEKNLG